MPPADNHDDKVELLRNIFKKIPLAQARFYLEQNGWDVARACSLYGTHMGHAPADIIRTQSEVERRVKADADAEREKECQTQQRLADRLFSAEQELLAYLSKEAPKLGTTVRCTRAGPSGAPAVGLRGVIVAPPKITTTTPDGKLCISDKILVKWDLPRGVDFSLSHESLRQPYPIPLREWQTHIEAVPSSEPQPPRPPFVPSDLNLTGKWSFLQEQGLHKGKSFTYEWKHTPGTGTFDGAQIAFDGSPTQFPLANAKITVGAQALTLKVVNVSWDVVPTPDPVDSVHCEGQLSMDASRDMMILKGKSRHREYIGEFVAHRRGHALNSERASIPVFCDGCHQQGSVGLFGWSCRVCNIDFCDECYESLLQRGAKWA